MGSGYDAAKVGDKNPGDFVAASCGDCPAEAPGDIWYVCTRIEGHAGQHVAEGLCEVKAVWPNEQAAS